MRLGLNLLAWSGEVGKAELELFPRIADLGYDGVELPLIAPDSIDVGAVRRALTASGLSCTASASIPRGASLLDPAERQKGVEWLGMLAAILAECGGSLLCGPLYSPIGLFPGRRRTRAEWESCVVGLRAAGDLAARYGVTLAVEPLNRFETYFLNTVDDAVALLDEVAHPSVGLHPDTFHMNIEEQDLPSAIARGARLTKHVHFSENDRGIVGSGHVDWPGVAQALRSTNYQGWVVAETFAGWIPDIAAATSIWRDLFPDAWVYARDSLSFMRRLLG